MVEHFNKLTPQQAEALAVLAEECGEVVQVIGKIMRHGLDSYHPQGKTTNLQGLHKELGDIRAAIHLCCHNGVTDGEEIEMAEHSKMLRISQYLHHATLYPLA
jgi:NTP pyrophosphatase (non-canonical NTP hydrolase)